MLFRGWPVPGFSGVGAINPPPGPLGADHMVYSICGMSSNFHPKSEEKNFFTPSVSFAMISTCTISPGFGCAATIRPPHGTNDPWYVNKPWFGTGATDIAAGGTDPLSARRTRCPQGRAL